MAVQDRWDGKIASEIAWFQQPALSWALMAVIGWKDKPRSWVVAGWAFRQVLEDVRSQCPTDSEIFLELERAEDLKYLFIDSFEEALAKRLANAIRDTASGIQSGKVRSGLLDKPYGTVNAIEEYRNSMQELVAVVSEHQTGHVNE